MNESISQTESNLIAIHQRIDQLLAVVARLNEENRSLRVSQESLMSERANLLSKNEQARSRVEAMINRLKTLEQNG
jgi:cell division protein ZapB